MGENRKALAFSGRIVMVGFGQIGQGTLPLLLRHIDLKPEQIVIVTGDENGLEVWTYERAARNVESKGSGYWVIFVWGSKEQAKSSTRSFTVIVKVDEQKKVREFAYHVVSY